MISILIPTYNYTCLTLVKTLQQQGEQLCQSEHMTNFRYEILVADDCSTQQNTIKNNLEINRIENCTYTLLPQNIGRAAIRNWLANQATYDYLLFIDSDAQVCSTHFLADYWNAVKPISSNTHRPETPAVVCGGLRNVSFCPGKKYALRFTYEADADKRRSASQRSKNPYAQFSTFNFLIARNIFCSIGFNEQCKHYGYEDVYFGMELKKKQISIRHIDNPLIHLGIDTNLEFLNKTETALKTLHSLDDEIKEHVLIAHTAEQLRKIHLLVFCNRLFPVFRPLLRRNLLGPHPSLFLFKLYKLGFYAHIKE